MQRPQCKDGSTQQRSPTRILRAFSSNVGRDFQNFDAQFVAQNARITEKRLAPTKGVNIGAAHADAMDAHQRLTSSHGGRLALMRLQNSGFAKQYFQHKETPV